MKPSSKHATADTVSGLFNLADKLRNDRDYVVYLQKFDIAMQIDMCVDIDNFTSTGMTPDVIQEALTLKYVL